MSAKKSQKLEFIDGVLAYKIIDIDPKTKKKQISHCLITNDGQIDVDKQKIGTTKGRPRQPKIMRLRQQYARMLNELAWRKKELRRLKSTLKTEQFMKGARAPGRPFLSPAKKHELFEKSVAEHYKQLIAEEERVGLPKGMLSEAKSLKGDFRSYEEYLQCRPGKKKLTDIERCKKSLRVLKREHKTLKAAIKSEELLPQSKRSKIDPRRYSLDEQLSALNRRIRIKKATMALMLKESLSYAEAKELITLEVTVKDLSQKNNQLYKRSQSLASLAKKSEVKIVKDISLTMEKMAENARALDQDNQTMLKKMNALVEKNKLLKEMLAQSSVKARLKAAIDNLSQLESKKSQLEKILKTQEKTTATFKEMLSLEKENSQAQRQALAQVKKENVRLNRELKKHQKKAVELAKPIKQKPIKQKPQATRRAQAAR